MRRFRFHIGTLLILVLILGVGFAALRESDETWDSSIFSLTLGMLSGSILLAIHRTEKRRAFWLGFALFGWTYVGLSLVPSIESRLLTTKALAYLDSNVPDRSIVIGGRVWDSWSNKQNQNNQSVNSTSIAFFPQGNLPANSHRYVNWDWIVTGSFGGTATIWAENFVRIGHSLLALIAAFVGGHLSRHLYDKNRQAVQGPASPLASTSSDASAG